MKLLTAALVASVLAASAARADDPPKDESAPHTVTVPWRRPPRAADAEPKKADEPAPAKPAEPETPKLPAVPKTPEQTAAEKAAADAWAAQALAEEERAAAEKARKDRERAAAQVLAAQKSEPLAAPLSTTLNPAFRSPVTASQAAWHSALLPGWGQLQTERPYRGYAFLGATGASLVGAVWMTVRARQADDIYNSAPPTVRLEAYNQARSYANTRNALWATTAALWALNVAEAYFLYGTKDR
jgi:hypothetical protein